MTRVSIILPCKGRWHRAAMTEGWRRRAGDFPGLHPSTTGLRPAVPLPLQGRMG